MYPPVTVSPRLCQYSTTRRAPVPGPNRDSPKPHVKWSSRTSRHRPLTNGVSTIQIDPMGSQIDPMHSRVVPMHSLISRRHSRVQLVHIRCDQCTGRFGQCTAGFPGYTPTLDCFTLDVSGGQPACASTQVGCTLRVPLYSRPIGRCTSSWVGCQCTAWVDGVSNSVDAATAASPPITA